VFADKSDVLVVYDIITYAARQLAITTAAEDCCECGEGGVEGRGGGGRHTVRRWGKQGLGGRNPLGKRSLEGGREGERCSRSSPLQAMKIL